MVLDDAQLHADHKTKQSVPYENVEKQLLGKYLLGAVLLPELLVLVSVDLLDHVERLANELLLDDLEQLVLLESLTRHVQRQIIGINLTTCSVRIRTACPVYAELRALTMPRTKLR